MSQVVPIPVRETVEATPRGPMTKARRLRIYVAHNGRCGECGVRVPLTGTTMDHALQLWMKGEDRDHNLRPLCPPCNKAKTAKDATVRAKTKRQKAKDDGTHPPSKRPLKSSGAAIQSRRFDQTKKRTFSGQVVERS